MKKIVLSLITIGMLLIVILTMTISASAKVYEGELDDYGEGGIYWSIDTQTKTLRIYGDSEDIYGIDQSMWREYVDDIETVIIEDGVSGIGSHWFCNLKNLEKVEIPDSIEYISAGAFYGCDSLKTISIPGSVR